MQPTLTDFRIESDNVVWLALGDGRTYRVSPADLGKVLSGDDMKRVRAALAERTRFMKRILPPTALFVLALSVVGLGNLDFRQLTHSTGTQQPPVAVNYCVPATLALPASLMPAKLFSVSQPEAPTSMLQSRTAATNQSSSALPPGASETSPAAQQPVSRSVAQPAPAPGASLPSASPSVALPVADKTLPQVQKLLPEAVQPIVQALPLTKPLLGL